MKARILFCLSLLLLTQLFANNAVDRKDKVTIYIFMQEECPICLSYTANLKQLHETYASENLQFIGLFPSPESTEERISEFKSKYEIPFVLETDHFHKQMEAFGATITPEVVVYNETQEEIIYKGRIDNTFFRVGKRRRITTSSELEDVLEALVNNKPIKVTETEAVGCVISQYKLSAATKKCH